MLMKLSAHTNVTELQGSVSIQTTDQGLNISWPDDFSSYYHYVWLRDCCYCELCGDSYSSKRYFQPSDISLDCLPQTWDINEEGLLEIIWEDGKHFSKYSFDWLRNHSYDDASRTQRFHQPTTWDCSIIESLPEVDFESASQSDIGRLELYRKLRDYGFVVVRSGPANDDGYAIVARLVGKITESAYGKVFDLTPDSKIQTLGNTLKPVAPHTDEAYRHNPPGVNILHCVRSATSGGESVLVDGFKLGEALRDKQPDIFKLLCTQPQPFHRIDSVDQINQQSRAPVFVLDEFGTIVGFRFHTRSAAPLDVPADKFLDIYKGNRELSAMMLSERYQAQFRLESGDAVLFDNQRVMHSRKGFKDPKRKMRICNVSREDFHENLRLVAEKLGFNNEASQILTTGVCG